ncbi:MAG: beta-lactamase family protein [Psychromonas sp.]|nr:beta-lactamase family protein [Psychromonas sp.]
MKIQSVAEALKPILMLSILMVIISCSVMQGESEERQVGNMELLNNLAHDNEPGFQYIVVNKNATIFELNVGLSDIEKGTALNSNHTMAAFSMTKTLTAIAVLQLVASNKINIDDSISDYIEHPYNAHISIRQLLSHTAGIANPIPLKWVHLSAEHDSFDEASALNKVLNENPDLDSQPGSEYRYSNIGYWLLGKVIEQVSGQRYSDYVTENVFDVLGLTSNEIAFLIKDENNHAKGYLKRWSFMNLFGRFLIDGELLGEYEDSWLHIKDLYLNGPSFGGAIGSATAFSKILQDLLSEQSKLLDDKSKQLLYLQQQTDTGKNIDMSLGWHIGKLNGITYYFKQGGGAGFRSEMRIYPDKGIASVIMTNKTSFNSRDILSKLDINYVEVKK